MGSRAIGLPHREEKSLSPAAIQNTFPWLCNQFPGHCVTPTVTARYLMTMKRRCPGWIYSFR